MKTRINYFLESDPKNRIFTRNRLMVTRGFLSRRLIESYNPILAELSKTLSLIINRV